MAPTGAPANSPGSTAGIIAERLARTQLRRGGLASEETACHFFIEAMNWYEKAETQRPAGNGEAILRWNTCARILASNSDLKPPAEESVELELE